MAKNVGVRLVEARSRLVLAAVAVLAFHYDNEPTSTVQRDQVYGELDAAAESLAAVRGEL